MSFTVLSKNLRCSELNIAETLLGLDAVAVAVVVQRLALAHLYKIKNTA